MVIILGSLYIPNIPLLVCGGLSQGILKFRLQLMKKILDGIKNSATDMAAFVACGLTVQP